VSLPADDESGDARYQAVLEQLHGRGRFGIRLGLGRTRALLRRLGDPQRELRGVLIGGTNGKGSTQALVAAALRACGERVGQTPKPHLVSYRERIVVDGQPIGVAGFTGLLEEILQAADAVARRHGQPTEFEVLTAAAFAWFARAGVRLGVIEVGMGGRLDATNVWQGGVSAITNVALDHTEHLGPTIVAIATEKAHIIKRGDSAAVTTADEPALGVIRRRAARVDVPLNLVEPLPVLGMDLDGVRVGAPGGGKMRVGLLGRHQAANAAVAWAILDALADAGIASVDHERRAAAFAATRWPGRLELIRRATGPDVILDGAHNPHGIAALAAALAELLPKASSAAPVLLMGVMANHWQAGMLEPLKRALPGALFVATTVPDSTNPLPPAQLAGAWGAAAAAIDEPDRALDAALARAEKSGGWMVVCGSLYLVGYMRDRLVGPNA
jgi:dihydrofolate synthase/folylpolyglutamate synthase